ncbi:MAG: hemerythrin domain-containing protein [bacterium]
MTHEFFQVLKKDHQEVLSLFDQIQQTPSTSVRTREDLFKKLAMELVPHLKSEERVYYPELREKKESHMEALKAIEEHRITEMVFNELNAMSKQEENFGAKLNVLKDVVKHHIDEEESKLFQITSDLLSREQIDHIAKSFKEEKEKIKSSMR